MSRFRWVSWLPAALVLATRQDADPPTRGDWIAIGVAALPLLWFAARLVTA